MFRLTYSDTPVKGVTSPTPSPHLRTGWDRGLMRVCQGRWEGISAWDLRSEPGVSRTLPPSASPRKLVSSATRWWPGNRLSDRGEPPLPAPGLWGHVSLPIPTSFWKSQVTAWAAVLTCGSPGTPQGGWAQSRTRFTLWPGCTGLERNTIFPNTPGVATASPEGGRLGLGLWGDEHQTFHCVGNSDRGEMLTSGPPLALVPA